MYSNVIDYTRNHVIELIRKQQTFLKELLNTEDLLKSRDDHQQRNIDRETAKLWYHTLEDEAYKVKRAEMTLAVVGTMKAGKSTTINAIVGTEVLPNRNQPMTTLPTLIRHEVGKAIPSLTFPKPEPFNQAVEALREVFSNMQEDGRLEELKQSSSDDWIYLIESVIESNIKFTDEEIIGRDEIYVFLKKLNDVSRLCDLLKIESPLIAYDSMDEFPLIEVEFLHLKNNLSKNEGRFTLIDTPGPNEAGAKYLKELLNQQIEKASAVMAVLDYTQLNAEADAEVRKSLMEIVDKSKNRLYVLVNKFDQRDRNGISEDKLKHYVAHQLFESKFNQSKVYPVSSKYAYLANRALHEVWSNGALPDVEQHDWVEDFGNEAMGKRWHKLIDDREEVEESAKDLWEDSLFERPLEEVIKKASSEAAFVSLYSSIDKMLYYDRMMSEALGLRHQAIKADLELLKHHVLSLENDIEKVNILKEKAQQNAKHSIKVLKVQFRELFEETRPLLDEKMKGIFWEKQDSKDQLLHHIEYNLSSPIFTEFLSSFSANKQKRIDIDPNGFSEFDHENDAREFVAHLYQAIEDILKPFAKSIQETASKEINRVEKSLWNSINEEIGPILQEASKRLNEVFSVELSFVEPKVHAIDLDFSKFQSKSIKNNKEIKIGTRKKRKWYTFWIAEKTETYTYTEDIYKVDLKSIGLKVLSELGEKHEELEKNLQQYVEKEIWGQIDYYFKDLSIYLGKFRGDLVDAMQDKQLEQKALGNVMSTMENIVGKATDHMEKVQALEEEVEQLKKGSLVNI